MSGAPAGARGVGRDLALLALAATLLFGAALGTRDLWNPNEPLYGRAVAEMARDGEWLLPTVNDTLFDEKPILYFWLARVGALAWGAVDEWSLRAPAALSAVACVVLTWLLVVPYAGRRRAWIAATLLATTFVLFWSARRVQMDVTLTACTLAVLLPLTRAVDHRAAAGRAWFVAGLAAGLGVLTKGPVGLICPGLPFLIYLVVGGRSALLLRRELWWAVVGGVLVALPWHVWLAVRGGSAALGELLYRQNVARFLEPWDHQAPWWYYLKYVWIDFAPWSWFLPLAVGLHPADDRERGLQRLSWIWLLTTIAFFSFSASKRSPYILPAAPAAAILVAGLFERWLDAALTRGRSLTLRALALVWGALLLVAGLAVPRLAPRALAEHPELIPRATEGAVLFGIAGVAILVAWIWRTWPRGVALVVLVLSVGAVELGAAARLLPAGNQFKSHRSLCEAINTIAPRQAPLRGYRLWKWRAGYSFYSERSVASLASPSELREYWTRADTVYLLVERGRIDEAREVIGEPPPLLARAVGSNFVYLFSNRATGRDPAREVP